MSKRFWFVILLAVIGWSVQAEDTPAIEVKSPPTVHDIASRRELFVDGALIDRLLGKTELRLHHPVLREFALVHDAAWEGNVRRHDRPRCHLESNSRSFVARWPDGTNSLRPA